MKKIPLISVLAVVLIAMPTIGGQRVLFEGLGNEVRHYKNTHEMQKVEKSAAAKVLGSITGEMPQSYTETSRWKGTGDNRTLILIRKDIYEMKNTLTTEYEISVNNEMRLLSMRRKALSPDGALMRERKFSFTDPSLDHPENTYNFLMMSWYLASKDLKPGDVHYMYAWFEPTLILPMVMKVVGEEKIKVIAGEFDCWKITIDLDKKRIDDLTGRIVSFGMPIITLWIDKNSPHRLIRTDWPLHSRFYGKKEWKHVFELVKVEK